MLLNSILNNSKDYIHISSLMRSEHKILYNTEDSFLIYFPESNIYIAESISDSLCELVTTFKAYYDAKRAEGRSHYNALGHCAGKLVRVIWKMLTDEVEFNLE